MGLINMPEAASNANFYFVNTNRVMRENLGRLCPDKSLRGSAALKFYKSETYKTLQETENGLWAESAEYITDRYYEEVGDNSGTDY